MFGNIQWPQFIHSKVSKSTQSTKTLQLQLMTTDTTWWREAVSSALAMRHFIMLDMRSGDISISMSVSGMSNHQIQHKSLQLMLINPTSTYIMLWKFNLYKVKVTYKGCWITLITTHWKINQASHWLSVAQLVDYLCNCRRSILTLMESTTRRGISRWLQGCLSKSVSNIRIFRLTWRTSTWLSQTITKFICIKWTPKIQTQRKLMALS